VIDDEGAEQLCSGSFHQSATKGATQCFIQDLAKSKQGELLTSLYTNTNYRYALSHLPPCPYPRSPSSPNPRRTRESGYNGKPPLHIDRHHLYNNYSPYQTLPPPTLHNYNPTSTSTTPSPTAPSHPASPSCLAACNTSGVGDNCQDYCSRIPQGMGSANLKVRCPGCGQ